MIFPREKERGKSDHGEGVAEEFSPLGFQVALW
jgi:hypothetical protein